MKSDTELVAKVKAMAQYPAGEKVAVGDSVTDINMALAADLVFARDCGCPKGLPAGREALKDLLRGTSPKDTACIKAPLVRVSRCGKQILYSMANFKI